jgi:integrase/recombinase XerD
MDTFKNYLTSQGKSNETQKKYYQDLVNYLDWCDTENIEAEQSSHTEILSYIQHLQKREVKQRTVQIYLNSLKHYFTWLIKTEIREDNPINNIKIQGVKRQHLYHILNKQELENLYENYNTEKIKNPKESPQDLKRNKAILGLIIWQGLGTTELRNLEEQDLKLREGKIYITGTRKSNERTLKLESTQVMDLMEYQFQIRPEYAETNKSTQLLLPSNGGSNFQNIITSLLKQLKRQNNKVTSIKQLRTSVITHWLKNYNLRETQYMAGHRYVSSTEAYQINDLDDLTEDIGKYHPIG